MPNPQQLVSGDALITLCAQKIQQRDYSVKQNLDHLKHAENHERQAWALTQEIAAITEAIKAGTPWAPADPPAAPAAERPGSSSIPRLPTQPI